MRVCCIIFIVGWLGITRGWGVDGLAAIVNDNAITIRQVEEKAHLLLEGLERTPFLTEQEYRQRVVAIKQQVLDELIQRQLILSDFKNGALKVPETYLDEQVDREIKKEFGDRLTMTKTLKRFGVSYETYRQQVRDGIVVSHMRHKNVSSGIVISPQKIEQFYATNRASYQLSNEVKLRMIVLRPDPRTPEQVCAIANEVLTKIEAGIPFPEMAGILSEGFGRQDGGSWGWRETDKMAKEIQEWANALNPGQCSAVFAKTMEIGVEATGTNAARDDNINLLFPKPKEEQEPTGSTYWVYHYDKAGNITSARKYSSKDRKLLDERKPDGQNKSMVAPLPPEEFYIMYVEEKRLARTRTLAEVRDEIEKELKSREEERLRKKWIEKLQAKSFVTKFL